MYASASASPSVEPRKRIAPAASAVAELLVHERDRDMPGVAIPRPEIELVVRFGPATRAGLDVHAMGVRQRVYRKLIRGGQRTVSARLHLGAHEAVLGVPASEIAGRVVALEDLWGSATTRRLCERLGEASSVAGAATILQSAIAERTALASGQRGGAQLALAAAERLTKASVSSVAYDPRVSERHLRRVFQEAIGMSPKTFARLARFRHALRAARESDHQGWASIAAAAGYYDQAHLIAEFRLIASASPQRLLSELRTSVAVG